MHCKIFRNSVEPAFCVTFEADITKFKYMVKKKVFLLLWQWYMLFANTYLNKDTKLFKVVNVPMIDDLREYCEVASKTANEQKEYFTGPLRKE